MLIVLTVILLLASVLVVVIHKSRETMFLSSLCLSLTIYLAGITVFIAKKGGFSTDVMRFLFGSVGIRHYCQYLYITLNTLGFMIALGRFLFPLFLTQIAMHYSHLALFRKYKTAKFWTILPLLLLLTLYHPAVYRAVIALNQGLQSSLALVSNAIILIYVLGAMTLVAQEWFSIRQPYFRRQFSQISLFLLSLSLLYLLYSGQDSGQVYRFYSSTYSWNRGLGYLQFSPTVFGYWLLVIFNVCCAVVGFSGFLRYAGGTMQREHDDMVLERKFSLTKSSVSVFVHSIKNSLLANRVLFKRLNAELEKESPRPEYLRQCVNGLQESNENLLARTSELYRSVKSKSVRLTGVRLLSVAQSARDSFIKKYPDGQVKLNVSPDMEIFADENYFSEALCNLLLNAWEAQLAADCRNTPVEVTAQAHRTHITLCVADHGTGIPSRELKHIFEPFYSSKNSNFNWGMGLWNVRTIVRSHMGSIRVKSGEGAGTAFYITVPRNHEGGKVGNDPHIDC